MWSPDIFPIHLELMYRRYYRDASKASNPFPTKHCLKIGRRWCIESRPWRGYELRMKCTGSYWWPVHTRSHILFFCSTLNLMPDYGKSWTNILVDVGLTCLVAALIKHRRHDWFPRVRLLLVLIDARYPTCCFQRDSLLSRRVTLHQLIHKCFRIATSLCVSAINFI